MATHIDSTEQHVIDDSGLTYADEATLLAATPASTLIGRIGIATSEGTYWLWDSNSTWVQIGRNGVTLIRDVTHSDASWYELFLDGSTVRATIPTDTIWAFEALIAGATSGQVKGFAFHILGAIENDGGTTALMGTPTVTTVDDSDDVSFDARATADDTNDALLIEVQDSDGASDVVRWKAIVTISPVTFA